MNGPESAWRWTGKRKRSTSWIHCSGEVMEYFVVAVFCGMANDCLWSGVRDSNPCKSAWKADAQPLGQPRGGLNSADPILTARPRLAHPFIVGMGRAWGGHQPAPGWPAGSRDELRLTRFISTFKVFNNLGNLLFARSFPKSYQCEGFCHGFATARLTPPFRLRPSRPTSVRRRMSAVEALEPRARRIGSSPPRARRGKCKLLVR
jgi:hypothetical protein